MNEFMVKILEYLKYKTSLSFKEYAEIEKFIKGLFAPFGKAAVLVWSDGEISPIEDEDLLTDIAERLED